MSPQWLDLEEAAHWIAASLRSPFTVPDLLEESLRGQIPLTLKLQKARLRESAESPDFQDASGLWDWPSTPTTAFERLEVERELYRRHGGFNEDALVRGFESEVSPVGADQQRGFPAATYGPVSGVTVRQGQTSGWLEWHVSVASVVPPGSVFGVRTDILQAFIASRERATSRRHQVADKPPRKDVLRTQSWMMRTLAHKGHRQDLLNSHDSAVALDRVIAELVREQQLDGKPRRSVANLLLKHAQLHKLPGGPRSPRTIVRYLDRILSTYPPSSSLAAS